MRGKLVSDISNLQEIIKEIKEYTFPNVVGEVSNKHIREFGEGKNKIALIDFGCKETIIMPLVDVLNKFPLLVYLIYIIF